MTEPPPTSGARLDELAGRLVAGRYRLVRLLASGGMAQVWQADDEVLARGVAVKLLHQHLAADPAFVERFRHEAIAAARLGHPSIVSIYDTVSDDGLEAIVMELVRGITLRQRLDEVHQLDVPDAVAVGAQVSDALEVAHKALVVHRDIKPANILLNADGRVMVADFGIAKALQAGDVTAEGMMLGTAKYLAPEQVEGATVDGRTDIYALGVVLYEALCGRPPFSSDSDVTTALARLHQTPLRLRQLRAGIPRPVEEAVLRAMARRPSDRFASAAGFRAALLAALDEPVPDALPPPPASVVPPPAYRFENGRGPAVSPPPPPSAPQSRPPEPPRQDPSFTQTERRWLVPALLVLLVAVGLGVAGVLLGRTDTGRRLLGNPGSSPSAIKAVSATPYDPVGQDGEDNTDAPNLIDSSDNTAWQTEHYNTPEFGNLKDGVGVYLTLSKTAAVQQLVVHSASSDWNAAVYVGDVPSSDTAPLSTWGKPVASKTGIGTGKVTIDLHGARGKAVLLWITRLGNQGDVVLGGLTVEG